MNDSFVFYRSWLEQIEKYFQNEHERDKVIGMLILYGIKGEKKYIGSLADMFLDQAYDQIDFARDRHAKRAESGRSGGKNGTGESKARRGNKNASKTQANASKTQANENVNDNVNVNENDNVNDNDNIYSSDRGDALTASAPEEEMSEERLTELYGELV